MPFGSKVPIFTVTSTDMMAPFIVYPMLWLGLHLPFGSFTRTHDYSYGLYVYGFVASQFLCFYGVYHWGYVPFTLATVVLTAAMAVASWHLVEHRALSLKSWNHLTHNAGRVAQAQSPFRCSTCRPWEPARTSALTFLPIAKEERDRTAYRRSQPEPITG